MRHPPEFFLGHPCSRCDAKAQYLVRNGDVPDTVCPRHLTDGIETQVEESGLTVYDGGLQIWSLREVDEWP
jgi:hypothetical protein